MKQNKTKQKPTKQITTKRLFRIIVDFITRYTKHKHTHAEFPFVRSKYKIKSIRNYASNIVHFYSNVFQDQTLITKCI